MKKLLMHKDEQVAEINIAPNGINISSVNTLNDSLMPKSKNNHMNAIKRWYIQRTGVQARNDYKKAIKFFGREALTSQSLCSLSDFYWLKDKDSDESWQSINPRNHMDMLKNDGILTCLTDMISKPVFNKNSPNLTLLDYPKQYWYENDGKIGIISFDAQRDMGMYRLARKLDLDIFHPRKYIMVKDRICTFKESGATNTIELVPFHTLFLQYCDENMTFLENVDRTCKKLAIDGKDFISQVLRFNTFGDYDIDILELYVQRNADTLEYISFEKV